MFPNLFPSNAANRFAGSDGEEKVSLMPGCELQGELFTQRDGWVGGKFSGTLVVGGRLVVAGSAEVQGVVVAGSIDVEPGARVQGICFVGPQGIEEWKRYREAKVA
ncbi:polymer-forming cytoskeletal protein [Methylacidimicrobium sp. AP8]|uniref:polymer-forming cytoskeletal protein n=1 Tax=Methylacidimicrobium sp. AP8 TaxID=2730359 RepID=UPI0019207F4E|nr:polymer-forming cytoskeletal protein [Methylacidimicrobium sp. AP8]